MADETRDYEPELLLLPQRDGDRVEGLQLADVLLRDVPDGHLACACPEPPRQLRILNPARRARVKHSRSMKQVRENTAPRLKTMHGERLLIELGRVAKLGFGLEVWQWLPQHVGSHSSNSYHKRKYGDGIGKAFDAYGAAMHAFADYVNEHAPQVDELIFNCCDSRKNGQHVPSSFWGSLVWGNHRGHAHVANDGPGLSKEQRVNLRETFVLLRLA